MERDDKALRRIISQLTGEWQGMAEEAADALFKLLKKGKPLAVALRVIKQQYGDLFTIPHLHDALVESACAGFGIKPTMLDEQTLAKVGHALSESWTGEELITLSQRIRGMGEEMSRTIVDTISSQMRANKGWIDASRALYDGYEHGHLLNQEQIPEYLRKVRQATQGSPEQIKEARKALNKINRLSQDGAPTKMLKAAYKQLVDAAVNGTEEELEKATMVAMEEKSRYIAERIIRTENARAWADGFIARANADEDCIGYKWIMDARHPVIDICDFYADADLYGMGAGVFPKGHAPALPAHPHCLCRFIEVYRSDKAPKNQVKKAGGEWLDKLTESERSRVLGKQGAIAFDKGKDWVKASKNLILGRQESRLAGLQDDLFRGYQSGAISGALNDKNDPDMSRRTEHAMQFYEARRRNGVGAFVGKISKNTGFRPKMIEAVYYHCFINKYELADGFHSFHPNYEMSQSFQRLLEGKNIQEHDIILLKHEHLELAIMKRLKYNYDDAHALTEKKYNYTKAEDEWEKRND